MAPRRQRCCGSSRSEAPTAKAAIAMLLLSSSAVLTDAQTALVSPPELELVQAEDGIHRAVLTLEVVENLDVGGGETITTRALGGTVPGPLIRFSACGEYHITALNSISADDYTNPTAPMNQFRDPNTFNIHTHGLHVSGDVPADDVLYTNIGPGESIVYEYVIPCDHVGGSYWYHPHHHGSSSVQVGGGAAGPLVVNDEVEIQGIPDAIAEMPETIVMIQEMHPDTVPTYVPGGADEIFASSNQETFYLANGRTDSVLSLEDGQWHRLRLFFSGHGANHRFTLTGVADGECSLQLLALDGVYISEVPRQLDDGAMFFTPASRVDVAVRCSEGEYALTAVSEGNEAALYTLFTVSVEPSASPPAPDLDAWTPCRPYYLEDLREVEEPDVEDTIVVRSNINGQIFTGPEDYLMNLQFQDVVQWYVEDSNPHPFHMHVNHMQVQDKIGVQGATTLLPGWYHSGDWIDTISTSTPTVIRFRVERFGGKAAMHCHIHEHSDTGVVAVLNLIGGQSANEDPTAIKPGSCGYYTGQETRLTSTGSLTSVSETEAVSYADSEACDGGCPALTTLQDMESGLGYMYTRVCLEQPDEPGCVGAGMGCRRCRWNKNIAADGDDDALPLCPCCLPDQLALSVSFPHSDGGFCNGNGEDMLDCGGVGDGNSVTLHLGDTAWSSSTSSPAVGDTAATAASAAEWTVSDSSGTALASGTYVSEVTDSRTRAVCGLDAGCYTVSASGGDSPHMVEWVVQERRALATATTGKTGFAHSTKEFGTGGHICQGEVSHRGSVDTPNCYTTCFKDSPAAYLEDDADQCSTYANVLTGCTESCLEQVMDRDDVISACLNAGCDVDKCKSTGDIFSYVDSSLLTLHLLFGGVDTCAFETADSETDSSTAVTDGLVKLVADWLGVDEGTVSVHRRGFDTPCSSSTEGEGDASSGSGGAHLAVEATIVGASTASVFSSTSVAELRALMATEQGSALLTGFDRASSSVDKVSSTDGDYVDVTVTARSTGGGSGNEGEGEGEATRGIAGIGGAGGADAMTIGIAVGAVVAGLALMVGVKRARGAVNGVKESALPKKDVTVARGNSGKVGGEEVL